MTSANAPQTLSCDSSASVDRPLVVDLDGTLIATDLLWESLFSVAHSHPLALLRTPFWLAKGKAHLKQMLAERSRLDVAKLPYHQEVLDFLKEQRLGGRRLILATAADQRLAREVAQHLGLFDEVWASNGVENLSRGHKLETIRQHLGGAPFDYIGNSHQDLPLWRCAAEAYIACPSRSVLRRAGLVCTPKRVFPRPSGLVNAAIRALRPHQWSKNLLVFVPLIVGHQLNWPKVTAAALAFCCFCLVASAVYLMNDLLDLQSDRQHRSKRNRPFASGRLPVQMGPPMIVALLAAAGGACLLLPLKFTIAIALYLLVTTAYSFYLKTRLLVDVICLAGLYTFRIIAGGLAAYIIISPWLLAFSMFFFLSLAFAKRYTELLVYREAQVKPASRRGYVVEDLSVIGSVGSTSGYLSVLVLSLYINGEATAHYRSPWVLWLLCPLLLYWITRIWFFASRGAIHDDPIVFALKDRVSYLCLLVGGAIGLWAWLL